LSSTPRRNSTLSSCDVTTAFDAGVNLGSVRTKSPCPTQVTFQPLRYPNSPALLTSVGTPGCE